MYRSCNSFGDIDMHVQVRLTVKLRNLADKL